MVEKAKLSYETPNLKPTSLPSIEQQTQEAGLSKKISHEVSGANALKQKIPMVRLRLQQDQPAFNRVTSGFLQSSLCA